MRRHTRPSTKFSPAGAVRKARLLVQKPPYISGGKKPTRLQKVGLAYERKAQEYLLEQVRNYIPSPWIEFENSEGVRVCQPDGFAVDFERGVIHVIEIKFRHTPEAWWQLTEKYIPVLKALFSPDLWRFQPIEVVRWYDPREPFPVRVKLVRDIAGETSGHFGVHIWRP